MGKSYNGRKEVFATLKIGSVGKESALKHELSSRICCQTEVFTMFWTNSRLFLYFTIAVTSSRYDTLLLVVVLIKPPFILWGSKYTHTLYLLLLFFP